MRGAPRYRFDEGEQEAVRFMNNRDQRILTTAIYDISETGIAIITHEKHAPRIGEVIKMDFAPLGSVRMACLGRVVRIDEELKNHSWGKFPDMVKVGIIYHDLPQVYRKTLVTALHAAFDRSGYTPVEVKVVNVLSRAKQNTWLAENITSVVVTALILGGVSYGIYRMTQMDPEESANRNGQNWATSFFDRTIKK
jgi:hypothetical protein